MSIKTFLSGLLAELFAGIKSLICCCYFFMCQSSCIYFSFLLRADKAKNHQDNSNRNKTKQPQKQNPKSVKLKWRQNHSKILSFILPFSIRICGTNICSHIFLQIKLIWIHPCSSFLYTFWLLELSWTVVTQTPKIFLWPLRENKYWIFPALCGVGGMLSPYNSEQLHAFISWIAVEAGDQWICEGERTTCRSGLSLPTR